MTEPFLAEIRMFGFNFPPRGWAFCDGQHLPIDQNQALFSLLGTIYGGDGRTDFALPDLRGRVPVHVGNGFIRAQSTGEETHALTVDEIPNHTHSLQASSDNASQIDAAGNVFANTSPTGLNVYAAASNLVPMGSESVANTGSGQGHENMQPFLAVRFCIAISGTFPPRN
ncbi:MAG: tail fiber protein [Kiloniellales bacterium]|nr:tail fiber protein [Kiloniellales bacterium]